MTRHADAPARSDGEGWAYTRLIKLHDAMRDDLALLRRVSAAVARGHEAEAAAALRDLSLRQPGWTLSRFCAAFCGFVHEHHAVEDAVMFPMLVQHGDGDAARLRTVIDKLTADHRILAGHLAEVERALAEPPDDATARATMADAVERLAGQLEAHLRFEETNLAAALNAMSRVVSEDDVPAPPPEHLSPEPPGP